MDFKEYKNIYQKRKVKEFPNNVDLNPILSICIQTFQHKDFIRDCLEGVLQQKTNFSLEILLGDDESNDGTREICLEYAKMYPEKIRLFLHYRENNIRINGGPTGRFNFSYNLFSARGKYLAVCEGDDYWTDPLKLQKQVDFLENNEDFALCFHNVNILNIRNRKKEVHPMHLTLKKNVFTTSDLLKPCFIHTASLLFRKKETFTLPNWFFQVESGDIALMLLISLEGDFKYLDEVMSVYRKHDAGISITHTGYSKAFSMIYLYQLFNNFTEGVYKNELEEAMKKEIYGHLPEFHELRKLRRNKKIKLIALVERVSDKIFGRR